MKNLIFDLAKREDAIAIQEMRELSAANLTKQLGDGPWSKSTKLAAVRDRIRTPDLANLKRTTLFIAREGEGVVGSVMVSTYPPGFWRQKFWTEGKALALGVFYLVVHPEYQRQGIGRFMMESIEKLARDHHIHWVRLDAYANNPISNSFYQSIGYADRGPLNLRGTELTLFEKFVG